MLPYQKSYSELFDSEMGRETLAAAPSVAQSFGREFTAIEFIDALCTLRGAVDTWKCLNALDHLVTSGCLLEPTAGQDVAGQYRRFRWIG